LFGLQLPLALSSIGTLLANCGDTYRKFPSIAAPSYLDWGWRNVPAVLILVLGILGAVVHLGAGWLAARLTRTGGPWAEAAGGGVVGLCAGLIAFATSIGPAFILALAVVPNIADLTLLGERAGQAAVATAPQPDRLAERYPELADHPASERGGLLFAKTIATNVTGIFEGVALGLAVSLALFVTAGIGLSLAAGSLVRRDGPTRAALVAYIEVGVALTIAQLVACGVFISAWAGSPLARSWFLVTGAIVVSTLTAVGRRWSARKRYTVYGAAIAAYSVVHLVRTFS
jgi:hypothetical protein